MKANAKLIAAAPNTIARLIKTNSLIDGMMRHNKNVKGFLTSSQYKGLSDEWMENKKAIQKATQ